MKHLAFAAVLAAGCFSTLASSGLCADRQSLGEALPLPPSNSKMAPVDASLESFSIDGVSGSTVLKALSKQYGDRGTLASRGRHDAELYKAVSPAVVIVVTETGIGSGSFIGNDQILTNWHVVKGFQRVGLIFKPASEGTKVTDRDVQIGEVISADPSLDLALVRTKAIPSGLRPIALGNESDIQIGADVHAIGHPTGEAWTYTKGIISQYRREYAWKSASETHKANVIQTQTPINPGNSGGPLVSDDEKLIGVNSFKVGQSENLNFAVSVTDVQRFLESGKLANAPLAKAPPLKAACETKQLYKGRDRDNVSEIQLYDSDCDGKVDFSLVMPDDTKKPILALIDRNADGKIDIRIEDQNRDGRWDISFHDIDFDGKIDLVGHHPDGKLTASRFEKYEKHMASR